MYVWTGSHYVWSEFGSLQSIMAMQRQQEDWAARAAIEAALSPNWARHPMALTYRESTDYASIARYLPTYAVNNSTYEPVPVPAPFVRGSHELRKLRGANAWQNGTRDDQVDQMQRWFPSVSAGAAAAAADKGNEQVANQPVGHDKAQAVLHQLATDSPARFNKYPRSSIGILAMLPGELRNRIYRLVFIEDSSQPIEVKMEPGTCSRGACLHTSVNYNAPAIASTCRQIRWETMSIYCVDHPAFRFDDATVHQSCVGNYLRSIGRFADLILDFQLLLKRPIWNRDVFTEWAIYQYSLKPPHVTKSGTFELSYAEKDDRRVCRCALDPLIEKMNECVSRGSKSIGKLVQWFVNSEEFADYVWRMRKSKQWPESLATCRHCGEVKFNN